MTITLYESIHNITGLKYFGKTEKYHTTEDLQKYYHGSGKYWKRHLKKHGDNVTMSIWYQDENQEAVTHLALMYSEIYNIVESDKYANLVLENGAKGNVVGINITREQREKISSALMGNIPWNKGKTNIYSSKTLDKMSDARTGKHSGSDHWLYDKEHSTTSKNKMSKSAIGKHSKKDNGMYKKITARDLRTGEYIVVDHNFFYENRFNKEGGYLVGNASKIKNF